jgi:formylmethanofuran--tetrahydromethanopterin N-formyltransferase
VHQAMQVGLRAAAALGPEAGPVRISAGNYGGKLGRFHYQLKELLA